MTSKHGRGDWRGKPKFDPSDRKRSPGAAWRDKGHGRGDAASEDEGPLRIFGVHAVAAVLANPRRTVLRIGMTENAENRLKDELAGRSLTVERMAPRDLDRLLGQDTVHQGVFVEVEPLPDLTLEDLIETAQTGGPIVVLDQVTDPHNVGAILRSCAVFGASGVVMTRRNSPPLNGALAKAASGALEVVPVALVPNLARALAELGEANVLRIGLDGEGTETIDAVAPGQPTALVLGSEGQGMRRLTREHCDRICRIGTAGVIASLNVSTAAAVALYALSAGRRS